MNAWFGIDSLRIDRAEEWPHVVRYWATSVHRPSCPQCGSIGRVVYHAAGKTMTIADLPARGKPTEVEVTRRRWKCGCSPGKTFSDREPGIHPRYRATDRLMRYVENAVTKRTIADVARETGMAGSTLGDIARALSADLDKNHRFPTPAVFSMDGIKMNGAEYMVFSEARRGWPLGIIDSIEATRCRAWLREYLDVRAIRIFVTDLHVTNLSVAKKPLGHALHVADKFHLVRDFQTALSRVVSRRLDELHKQGSAVDAEELFDAKPAIMTIDDARRMSRERRGKAQQSLPLTRLSTILAKHDDVNKVFWARWDLFQFYSSTSWADAEPHLDRFYRRVEGLRHVDLVADFIKRLERHKGSVLNYFDSVEMTRKGRLRGATTNAAEQRNGTIRKAWRSGHGIRQIELLRLRTVYEPWQINTDIVRCAHPGCSKWLGPLYGPWPCPDPSGATSSGPQCFEHG